MSSECEESRHFFHLTPSILRANRLFEGTGILRSKPHLLPLSEHPTERSRERIIPIWPVAAAPPLAMRSRTSLPISRLRAGRAREGVVAASHVGMVFPERSVGCLLEEESEVWI